MHLFALLCRADGAAGGLGGCRPSKLSLFHLISLILIADILSFQPLIV